MNSRGKDFETKQEGDVNESKYPRTSTSTSRQWAGFRNPRIVRVSRSFGGKDRHSKVCTVRGLRDRRIRLSVPTAIQLYDLQDRLGLSQPSKVVDWLLDATKTDIDKLPPLQIPPGSFQFHQAIATSSSTLPHFFNPNPPYLKDIATPQPSFFSSCSKEGIIHGHGNDLVDRSKYWMNPDGGSNRKEGEREAHHVVVGGGKDKWIASNHHHQESSQGSLDHHQGTYAAAQNLFPIANQSSFPTLLNNAALPYNPFYHHWEPSNLSLSQLGSSSHSNIIPIQTDDSNTATTGSHINNSMALPSGSHHHHHHHQLYFCPSAATLPAINVPSLPSYMAAAAPVEINDPRQISHFQFLSNQSNSLMPTLHLISSPLKSLTLNVNPKILHSQGNNNDNHPNNKGGGTTGSSE